MCVTQKQIEAVQALTAAHREQDISHQETVRRHKEIMDLIDKAKEGLHEKASP